MALIYGLTFGDVKDDLASVVANGTCGTDPRVLKAANEATRFLLQQEIIPVNCMATYDVVAVGTILFLPEELENAIEVEPLGNATVNNQSDIRQGFHTLVSNFSYVDPSAAQDNPLVDLFLDRDPTTNRLRRKYDYPGLTAGSTVRVTGKKRYIAMTADGDSLIVQNTLALKSAILYREYLLRGANSVDDANKYKADALSLIEAEVKQHLLDPRRALKRKADYQLDISTYVEGTLGRTRGRLALELNGFLLKGKSEITYLVNRAVQMLVDNRNQLAIAGRISVHGTTTELSYTPATTPETVLTWGDYNQIRLMVQSFITESGDPQQLAVAEEYQKKAFELQRAQLIEETEKKRHTTYTTALATYVSGTFGWTVARLALEMPGGLAMTVTEIERLVSMAEMRLLEKGLYKGSLKTLSATITGGEILFPRDVEAVLAADICGQPVDIRSAFFEFQKNGPGESACESRFIDQGEVFFPQTGSRRRKYLYRGVCDSDVEFTCVAKVRWIQKESCDELAIKNFEAIRLMSQSIQHEKNERWNEAGVSAADAKDVLERELQEYLGGIQHVQSVDTNAGFGFGDLGSPL